MGCREVSVHVRTLLELARMLVDLNWYITKKMRELALLDGKVWILPKALEMLTHAVLWHILMHKDSHGP